MPNPYSYGPLVTNPAMFFGREEELNTLCTRLRNMQSTSVVGLRRIGKSSLLNQLARTLRDELGEHYVPLYIDLQDARYRTVAGFVQTIAGALNAQMGGILTISNVTEMSSFSDLLERLNRNGIRPVLCLDEFEEFMQHPEEFNNDFLEALRALGTQSRLAMVTASYTPLVALIQAGQFTSPFPNIFSQIDLGLLELEAARRLRYEPFEKEGITLSPEDKALIEELGGRHPCFLQMACYHFYEAQVQPPSTRADVVRERFNQDAEPHFKRLWEHLDAGDKFALKAVIDQDILTSETESKLQRLARLGLVEQAGGDWRIFSPAFAARVRQYPIQPQSERPEEIPEEPKASPPSTTAQVLLFAGVAIAAVIVAALVGSLVPEQKIRPMLIVASLVLLFTLVGAGKLTGYDFLQWLGKLLGLGGS